MTFYDLIALNNSKLKKYIFSNCTYKDKEEKRCKPPFLSQPQSDCFIAGRKLNALGGRERHFLLFLPA